MIGTDLPDWRKRNRFTQDALRMALGVKSRQTIISWEKSTQRLSRLVELALMALEQIPEAKKVYGASYSGPAEYKEQRARPTEPRH
jgi:transcriptional regulator with XRE-family HTH domain